MADVKEGARKDVDAINSELAKIPRVIVIVQREAAAGDEAAGMATPEQTYQQLAALYGGN